MDLSDHQKFADRWKEHLEKGGIVEKEFLFPVLLEKLGDLTGQTVLDAGAGNGWTTPLLKEAGAETIVTVDFNPFLIREIREKFGDNILNILGNTREMPFSKEKFDTILCKGLFMNQNDDSVIDTINQFQGITAPNGRIIGMIVHPHWHFLINQGLSFDDEEGLVRYQQNECISLDSLPGISDYHRHRRPLEWYKHVFEANGWSVTFEDVCIDREFEGMPERYKDKIGEPPVFAVFTATKNKRTQSGKPVDAFSTAPSETDTYDLSHAREQKEALSRESVLTHWNTRAERKDIQAVMSARHTVPANIQATIDLQQDIFEFLEDYLEGKRILELGVGIGRMTYELAKKAKHITGVDFSPAMLERACVHLANLKNVNLYLGKITDPHIPQEKFDLVFESIVLLHILNPNELAATIQKMQELSDRIFILEHTYEGPNFPISKYSILRTPEEYEELFQPYSLVKQQTHKCAGDRFTMMLLENPEAT